MPDRVRYLCDELIASVIQETLERFTITNGRHCQLILVQSKTLSFNKKVCLLFHPNHSPTPSIFGKPEPLYWRDLLPKKTTSPFSLRFSHEERQELVFSARSMAVGTYIRSCLFQNKIPTNCHISKIDTKALTSILAKLGQSNMSANLKDMAQLARTSSLPLSPMTITKIETACQDIAIIKTMLMKALHIKEQ